LLSLWDPSASCARSALRCGFSIRKSCPGLSVTLGAGLSRGASLPDNLAQELETALNGAYAIERELGGGGMSRVFLASERALRRQVVIKVLAPELARGVSADRFRLEIQVAASLHHPHIVPLLTAGEAAGHLYYTMPFVAGESLRTRLAREGELPVSAAVHVLTDIARALAYAHRQGIVHRDIKPENVLFAEGEAQVADFGIAKALSASAQSGSLTTSAGLALGTPVYMAPEQAMADLTADHRADLYALGVVGYEMLAGQPPFTGRSPQHLFAAHASETPMPVEQRRVGLPPVLARLIMRLLQKRAADRPQSANEVLAALEAVGTPAEGTATVAVRHNPTGRGRWLAAAAVAALVLSLAWFGARPRHLSADRQVVAIAPFRVTGADSSLSYLREGMVDLLATKLGGTSGLRPTDPRTILAAWGRTGRRAGELGEADAIRIAGAVGAGRLVQGEVVGSGRALTVSARIIDVASGATNAQATAEGPVDSLPRLVDRLAASLLALGAGEEEQRLEALTSTSLPALRAYLDGEALLRRSAYKDANRRFQDAQALDSTFALAGLGAMRAAEWYGEDTAPARGVWAHRDRLSSRDRAWLETILGPRYPAPSSVGDYIKAAERFAQLAPDSPEAWYRLGDNLWHNGALVGLTDTWRRASAAFNRSLSLDSTYSPAIEHLGEIAAGLDDSAGARRGLALLTRLDSLSPIAQARRWNVAAILSDTAEMRKTLASDSIILDPGPWFITIGSFDLPLNLAGTEAIYPRALAHRASADDRAQIEQTWSHYELMRGHPSHEPPLVSSPVTVRQTYAVLGALFADGDSARGRAAGDALERQLGRPLPAGDHDQVSARFAAGQYAVATRRAALARQAINDLRTARAASGSPWQSGLPRAYALLLEAQVAATLRSADAPERLRQLDSALADPVWVPWASYGNLIAARLHEERGEIPAALAAVRRRAVGMEGFPHYVNYLREEGRLAALTGDRQGAIRAYRHYLALRGEAEPGLQPEVQRVREELEAVERESADH
jgi:serine/threonine protein kinase